MSLADEDKQALQRGPIGSDNPKWEEKEVLTIRQLAQFFTGYFPDDNYLRLHSAEAYADEKLLDEEEDRILSCIVSGDFSHAGCTINAGKHYMNKLAILAWYEFLGKDCPPVLLPKAMKNIIFSLRDKIQKLRDEINKLGNNTPPCYLDLKNDIFCPELRLALDVCEALYVNNEMPSHLSSTNKISTYLDKNYVIKDAKSTNMLPKALVDRIRAVCTPKKPTFKIKG